MTSTPAGRPALVCVVGPPASGKSLLIVSLTEALRQRGRRVASAVLRGASMTVITLPNGARATLERAPAVEELAALVRSMEPNADLVLAEGFSGPGVTTIELVPADGRALMAEQADLLAVVASTKVIGDFEVFGPGETGGLADLIEARLLTPRQQEPPPSGRRGFFNRLRRR